uniref:Chitin-binding type-2 domain-containing protein n=1 Tax=Daphnia galeata TaxID=27404 RepID=A0A8J2RH33_9CRUS|nr:unnamed protein product [Daphnia galeata]
MSLASLYLGVVFVLSFIVVDCASMETSKPSRIGRKLLGRAGEDYPKFPVVPSTTFKCTQNKPGYYADVDALCQVFHVCQIDGRHDSFICPNGTLFNQNYFVCDWWYNVDCSAAPSLYILNELLFQHPLLSAREHANTNSQPANPDPSTNSYDVKHPSRILPARPENFASANQQQQHVVTATAAREHHPQQQQQQLPSPNAGEKYGSKIPSVNRMGGLETAELIENNLVDNRKIALVAPVTDSEVLLEMTEASPTTIQPFNEEEFTSNLKLKLNVEEQQFVALIFTTNAPEGLDENNNIVNTLITSPSPSQDTYNLTGGKLAESSTDSGVESVQNIVTANEQQLDEEFSTVQPNLANVDAQTSAVVVTENSASEKDFDDYGTTTHSSPTTDPAAHFLELPDISPAVESTEYSSSTNKTISSSSDLVVVADSTESNFVTELETTTFPAVSLQSSTDSVVPQELPELQATAAPDLLSSPIVESLDFNLLTDSNSFSSSINFDQSNNNATDPTALLINVQVSTTAFAETSIIPSNNINADFSNSSQQLTTPTTSASVTTTSSYKETTPAASTTSKPIKNKDSPVISLITYSNGKQTLYEKLKPTLVGDTRPIIPAVYGRKIHPRGGNKNPKSF